MDVVVPVSVRSLQSRRINDLGVFKIWLSGVKIAVKLVLETRVLLSFLLTNII